MKQAVILGVTALIIAALNWLAALLLNMSFLDLSIPVAATALVLIYFFNSKGGMASRQMDMAIQGQTGIRMEQKIVEAERSYVLIGAILYLVIMVLVTFIAYREYFIGIGA